MPRDTSDGIIESTTDVDQDARLLDEEVVEPVVPETKPAKVSPVTEPDEPTEEGEELEEELETEEEEPKPGVETEPLYDRPSFSDIKKEFPEFFKKFPSMRDRFFREQEFSNLFPTLDDAKVAQANAQAYDDLSGRILNGSSAELFSAIKEADPKAIEKIAVDILPALYKVSPDLHYQATLPLLQNVVRAIYNDGKKANNENLTAAAEWVSNYLFGDHKVASGEKNIWEPKAPTAKDPEREQFERERNEFNQQRRDSFTNGVRSQADEDLKKIVLERGQHNKLKIDPDGIFTEFIRDTITAKVLQNVDQQLAADKTHQKYMGSLWNAAQKAGWTDEHKSRILSAYLARAKSLIPAIRAKYVSEAMGTTKQAAENKGKIVEKNGARREPGTGGRGPGKSETIDVKRVNWDKTSDLDILEDRVSYRSK